MATTKTAPAPAAAKAQAPAPVAHVPPLNSKGQPMAVLAPAPVAQAPLAPLYLFAAYNAAVGMGWPAKAMSGASVRAYCAKVAQALTKAHPNGFTVAQYAVALADAQAGTTYRLPANGFGTAGKPNATARQHATWFTNTGKFLVPAPVAKA